MKFITPVYELFRDGSRNRIFVKREDLLPDFLGGNKVRIAEAFFRDMEARGCDAMIGYGDVRSNLCRVLAGRCHQKKIPCWIICTGGETEGSGETANSWIMELAGAQLVPCGKNQIRETVERLTKQLKEQGYRPYYIYGNSLGQGNEGTAAEAYAPIYREILDQGRSLEAEFDLIFLPSGTGATQSGLVCGRLLEGGGPRIIGISISRDQKRGTEILRKGVEEFFRKRGREVPPGADREVILEDRYRKGGYGCYDGEVLKCIRQVFLRTGVPWIPPIPEKPSSVCAAICRRKGSGKKTCCSCTPEERRCFTTRSAAEY